MLIIADRNDGKRDNATKIEFKDRITKELMVAIMFVIHICMLRAFTN